MYLLKSNKQKTLGKIKFLMASCQPLTEKAGPESVSHWYGSADPDSYQNVTVPQH
jgi:hypothetical protein